MPIILNEEVNLKIECDCGTVIESQGLTENDVITEYCPDCKTEIIIETGETSIYNA